MSPDYWACGLYKILRNLTITYKLTIMSPSSGISRILCRTIPLWATEPSDLRTQLSVLLPNGILFKSHLFVASPTPQAPVSQTCIYNTTKLYFTVMEYLHAFNWTLICTQHQRTIQCKKFVWRCTRQHSILVLRSFIGDFFTNF